MVHFVGAGPGAADLITVRGQELLKKADVIIYAGSLIDPQILNIRKKSCKVYDSAYMTLEEINGVIEDAEEEDLVTVRLHSGDPCLYGAVAEQIAMLRDEGIDYDICPGVSSLCAAAGALEMEYTLPGVSQTVVISRMPGRTSVPEKERIRSLAYHGSSMVLFLSAGMIGDLAEELTAGGYPAETSAAVCYKATWPEEKTVRCTVGTLKDAAEQENIESTALIIVGDAVGLQDPDSCRRKQYRELFAKKAVRDNGSGDVHDEADDDPDRKDKLPGRSRLYDPDFSTGYRKGKVKAAVMSFTAKGDELSLRLIEILKDAGIVAGGFYFGERKGPSGLTYVSAGVREWTASAFSEYSALIYVGAAGIALRSTAPYVNDKFSDPAVIVIDEKGQYVIPVLSGHLGGANMLADEIAGRLGALAVITTATDINSKFAVDLFAKKNGLIITDRDRARRVSADILAGKDIGIYLADGIVCPAPGQAEEKAPGIKLCKDRAESRITVDFKMSCAEDEGDSGPLVLIPECAVWIGIGCKRGTTAEALGEAVADMMSSCGLMPDSVAGAASVTLKADEEGLLELCRDRKWKFMTFSPEVLMQQEGHFSSSDFVLEHTGADNICERAAVCAAGAGGRLLVVKRRYPGITLAASAAPRQIRF